MQSCLKRDQGREEANITHKPAQETQIILNEICIFYHKKATLSHLFKYYMSVYSHLIYNEILKNAAKQKIISCDT